VEILRQRVDELRFAGDGTFSSAVIDQGIFWQLVVVDVGTRQRKLQTELVIAHLIAAGHPASPDQGIAEIAIVYLHKKPFFLMP